MHLNGKENRPVAEWFLFCAVLRLRDNYSPGVDIPLLLPRILLVRNNIMPNRLPHPSHKMRHGTIIIGPMPMRSTRRSPNNIPRPQPLRSTPFVTNPAISGNHSDELTLWVRVPVCAGAGGKGDVGD